MPCYDDRLALDDAIRRVFPKADPHGIRLLIERAGQQAGAPFGPRVELACVLLSAGDLKQLRHYLEQARSTAVTSCIGPSTTTTSRPRRCVAS